MRRCCAVYIFLALSLQIEFRISLDMNFYWSFVLVYTSVCSVCVCVREGVVIYL